MGRKMKNIVALLVILGLIYWQQSPAVRPAYAWDESCGEQNRMDHGKREMRYQEEHRKDHPTDRERKNLRESRKEAAKTARKKSRKEMAKMARKKNQELPGKIKTIRKNRL